MHVEIVGAKRDQNQIRIVLQSFHPQGFYLLQGMITAYTHIQHFVVRISLGLAVQEPLQLLRESIFEVRYPVPCGGGIAERYDAIRVRRFLL